MNKLTATQLDRVRRAPIAERLHQYVGGIQVQALIEHVVAVERENKLLGRGLARIATNAIAGVSPRRGVR